MDSPGRHRFAARESEFEAIRSFIDARCATMQHDDRQRVILLVEELFANSVHHGYGGDSDQSVWLTVAVDNNRCRLIYEDCAPAHDPFALPGPDHVDANVEDRPIGGLGIVLLTEISSRYSYERRGNRNVIEFDVARSRAQ